MKEITFIIWILFFTSCSSPVKDSGEEKEPDVLSTVTDTPSVAVDTAEDTMGIANASLDTVIKDSTIKKKSEQAPFEIGEVSYMGEQAVIYKTRKDYSKYVPVKMNSDKTKIVSYPSPKDIFYNGKLAFPVKLRDGYWLDNRGITSNSVFTNITYEEYAKLKDAPSLSEMIEGISDKDPFVEIYSLGNRARFKEEKSNINEIIERGALKKFKKIK